MKTSMLVLCVSSVLIVLHVAASQYFEEKLSKPQEKEILYSQRAALEEQKNASDKKELLWRSAKIFGTAAVVGFLAYTAFSFPYLFPKEDPIVQPKPLQWTEFLNDNDSQVISEQTKQSVLPSMSDSIMEQSGSIKKLTPQERVLYELRYKNYGTWTGVAAGTIAATRLIFGAFALPVDLALFGIAALSGDRSWYYKQKLAESE